MARLKTAIWILLKGRIPVSLLAATLLLLHGCAEKNEGRIPLADGTYEFQHKYAEHPDMASFLMTGHIQGRHIRLYNDEKDEVFPRGLISEGELFWHADSQQWIIVTEPEDKTATDVGGCSGGPNVVDLVNKVYWTC